MSSDIIARDYRSPIFRKNSFIRVTGVYNVFRAVFHAFPRVNTRVRFSSQFGRRQKLGFIHPEGLQPLSLLYFTILDRGAIITAMRPFFIIGFFIIGRLFFIIGPRVKVTRFLYTDQ